MKSLLFMLSAFLCLTSYGQAWNGTNVSSEPKKEKETTKEDQLELEVKGVYDYGIGDSYAVRLIEKGSDGKESLVMIIGQCEATGLARSLYNQEFSRPLTYDLFNSVFASTSINLKHVLIRKLEDGTYYAFLFVEDNGKIIKIDSRPSDGMNIALKTGAPIYADQELWDENKEVDVFEDE